MRSLASFFLVVSFAIRCVRADGASPRRWPESCGSDWLGLVAGSGHPHCQVQYAESGEAVESFLHHQVKVHPDVIVKPLYAFRFLPLPVPTPGQYPGRATRISQSEAIASADSLPRNPDCRRPEGIGRESCLAHCSDP